jgi:hypothetical protein
MAHANPSGEASGGDDRLAGTQVAAAYGLDLDDRAAPNKQFGAKRVLGAGFPPNSLVGNRDWPPDALTIREPPVPTPAAGCRSFGSV